MKASIAQIVDCYNVLGESKVTKLEESEVIKIVKARKTMRSIAEEFEAFSKDIEEKLKHDGFEDDEKIRIELGRKFKENHSYQMTYQEEESMKRMSDYFTKIFKAKNEEGKREIEIELEPFKLKEDTSIKILSENGYELKRLDKIDLMF